jgi:hypothetical protein
VKKRARDPRQREFLDTTPARDLVDRLSSARRLVDEVDRRGGIVRLLDDARLNEPGRRALTGSLVHVWRRLRGYVVAIGDDRRAKGLAQPLCWWPDDPEGRAP